MWTKCCARYSPVTYALFFIIGHIIGGLVTVTDGDRRLITILNMSLHNNIYIRYGKSNLRVAYHHELMSCLCPRNEAAFSLKSGISLLAHDPS
jgi:hypothetical protein